MASKRRGCAGVLFSLLGVLGCGQPAHPPSGEGAAHSTKIYKWKMVTTWPKNFPGLGMAPERFAKVVKAMSGGRLRIKVYGGGELVPPLEVFDTVSQGTAELGHGASYYWKGKVPEAQFFCSVPFGLNAQEMNGWLRYGGGMELWEEAYAPHNLIPLAAGNTGVQMGGWFRKEIRSLADIKGLKMRMPGLGGEIFERAGGVPVLIAGGEIFTSLQTGAIDATEWVGPYNDLTFGFYKVAKVYHYPGWQEPGPTLELIVNKKAFMSLPEDLQAIVRVAADHANQTMMDEYAARNPEALETLEKKYNVKVIPFPQDVLEEFKRISDEVLQELAGRSDLGKRVYASYRSFRDRSRRYLDVTERAFLESR